MHLWQFTMTYHHDSGRINEREVGAEEVEEPSNGGDAGLIVRGGGVPKHERHDQTHKLRGENIYVCNQFRLIINVYQWCLYSFPLSVF